MIYSAGVDRTSPGIDSPDVESARFTAKSRSWIIRSRTTSTSVLMVSKGLSQRIVMLISFMPSVTCFNSMKAGVKRSM
jgi:hypothetical protein